MMYNSAVEFLYSTVRRHPSKICLADQDSMLSFEEFFAKAFALSQMLSHDSRNAPVLVFLPKSVEAVVSFAAILLSGNFYIPIDTKSPQRRLVNILENIQPYKEYHLFY